MARARRGSGGGTPPASVKVLADRDLSPAPPDLWGPYRPRFVSRTVRGVECLALALGTLGAFLGELDSWSVDSLGHWHRV